MRYRYTMLGRGWGHGLEARSGGCEETSSLGGRHGWWGREERPTPAAAEAVEKKISTSVGFLCLFHQNSKSRRVYCLHRKNVIRGSKKAHVGLRTSAVRSGLKNN